MKRFLTIITIAAFCVSWGVQGPEAKFFTDPSVPLEQSDWEGKKKSTAPAEEYQYKKDKEEEQPEEIKKEEKKKKKQRQRKKRKRSSAQQRKKFQFGLKIAYNVIPETETKVDGFTSYEKDLKGGDRYSVDMGMELIVNILGGHLGLGAGAGTILDYHSNIETTTMMYVPVYAIAKGYFLKGTSPFISLSLGYNVYTYFNTTNDDIVINGNEGGLYFAVGGGFITSGGLQIEIQYVMVEGAVTGDHTGYGFFDATFKAKHSHLSIGIAKFF